MCSVSTPFGNSSPGPSLTGPPFLLPCGARESALRPLWPGHLQAPECLSWSIFESSLLHRAVLPSLTCSRSIRSHGHHLSTSIGCHSLGPSTGSVHCLPFRRPVPESRPGSLCPPCSLLPVNQAPAPRLDLVLGPHLLVLARPSPANGFHCSSIGRSGATLPVASDLPLSVQAVQTPPFPSPLGHAPLATPTCRI